MNGFPLGLIFSFVGFLKTPATQEHRHSVHRHTNILDEVRVFCTYSLKLLWIYNGAGLLCYFTSPEIILTFNFCALSVFKFVLLLEVDQYQYLSRRRYVSELDNFTIKRLM